MKKKINLMWYIKRLEYLAREHKSLNDDKIFKSVMNDLNKLDNYNVFREVQ
jgi:uncharacterized protein (UPF0335 family)